jgi:hypothetical protein
MAAVPSPYGLGYLLARLRRSASVPSGFVTAEFRRAPRFTRSVQRKSRARARVSPLPGLARSPRHSYDHARILDSQEWLSYSTGFPTPTVSLHFVQGKRGGLRCDVPFLAGSRLHSKRSA